jgi:CheY-specific phosphatase CheX
MSLPTLPKPPAPDIGEPIRAAVTAVAERSFYAFVDGCDDPAGDASASTLWLASIVRFNGAGASGTMACWLPPELALTLFDSFSGRAPEDTPPLPEQVDDLVGEFSNMVCGDWLTRYASEHAFQLSPPLVVRAPRPDAAAPRRLWMKVNDCALAVDWDIAHSHR